MDSPTEGLSKYIAAARYENIPREVIEDAKDYILDSIGCVIGGAALKPGKIVITLFDELGGCPEATILPTGKKLPCIHAAYVNSYLANVLDFDDTSTQPLGHPGATIVPAGLALAEKIGVAGKDFITAVVTAYEGWVRISQAIEASPERAARVCGFGTNQIFGTAIVASKLLNFNAEQTANTLGLAGFNAPVPSIRKQGLNLEERPITWAKNNYGWASMGGILAALLTEKGFVGNKYILDGEMGFWAMAGSDQCDFDRITRNLGKDYLISRTGFKPYAACRWIHSSLEATARIVAQHAVNPKKIRNIKVSSHHDIVRSLAIANPPSICDAQFSLPHQLALELLGRSSSKGLSDDDITDPEVRSLAEKVSLELSPEIEEAFSRKTLFFAAVVSIELTDGSVFSERVDIPMWEPTKERPARDALRSKFIYLTAPIIGAAVSEAVVCDLEQLENLEDVSAMILRISGGN